MRSRLEADMAAELDSGGWTWEYEPRAFANQHGQYLPDFLVRAEPEHVYLEVKPTFETAYMAMERVQIVWDSEPRATLVIFINIGRGTGWGFIAKGAEDRKWRAL